MTRATSRLLMSLALIGLLVVIALVTFLG